jgi:hypothetical protein
MLWPFSFTPPMPFSPTLRANAYVTIEINPALV